mmetsp:Transcript_10335/g.25330  ORF Transcript_10335/g.25330 Transcript_10335/m.25330 type:complete len:167 (+) Transcript_10335:1183-1683(+)
MSMCVKRIRTLPRKKSIWLAQYHSLINSPIKDQAANHGMAVCSTNIQMVTTVQEACHHHTIAAIMMAIRGGDPTHIIPDGKSAPRNVHTVDTESSHNNLSFATSLAWYAPRFMIKGLFFLLGNVLQYPHFHQSYLHIETQNAKNTVRLGFKSRNQKIQNKETINFG